VRPNAVEREGSGGFPPDYDKSIFQRGGGNEYNERFVVVNLCRE
jgi:hypothetical protein